MTMNFEINNFSNQCLYYHSGPFLIVTAKQSVKEGYEDFIVKEENELWFLWNMIHVSEVSVSD
jgi:hypothetical protein